MEQKKTEIQSTNVEMIYFVVLVRIVGFIKVILVAIRDTALTKK